jgi:hypothetical protein
VKKFISILFIGLFFMTNSFAQTNKARIDSLRAVNQARTDSVKAVNQLKKDSIAALRLQREQARKEATKKKKKPIER